MKTKDGMIPVELTGEQITQIEELARASGKTFQETFDEFMNGIIEDHFDEWLEAHQRKNS